MIVNALQFLLQTILGMFAIIVLLRFYLQLVSAPFQNPASQFVVALSNFIVKPTRRIIPSWRGFDLSTLLLAFIAEWITEFGLRWLADFPFLVAGSGVWIALIGLSINDLFKLSIYIFLYATVIQAVLSWLTPYSPIAPVLNALTRPILNPIRKHIPLVGGFDLSPIVIFIGAQLLIMLLVMPLDLFFSRMF
jgi:YggT family protein